MLQPSEKDWSWMLPTGSEVLHTTSHVEATHSTTREAMNEAPSSSSLHLCCFLGAHNGVRCAKSWWAITK